VACIGIGSYRSSQGGDYAWFSTRRRFITFRGATSEPCPRGVVGEIRISRQLPMRSSFRLADYFPRSGISGFRAGGHAVTKLPFLSMHLVGCI